VQLHQALEAERFGSEGKGSPGPALLRDIESALREIPSRIRRRSGLAAVLALLMLGGGTPLQAQDGLTLYARREYAAAAQAFRKEPPSPARWYDLAAAEYMARRDAYAVAALLSARAAAPRDSRVQALWTALSREHEQLRRAGRRWPVTALELFGAGLVLLWLGALLFVVLRRHRRAGESVSTQFDSPIVTLADDRVRRVRVDVDEADVGRIAVGQAAYVTADAFGDRRFPGTVVRIGQLLGRKNVRTDEPTERVDSKILETLVELEDGRELPFGLRVQAFIGARQQN